MSLHPRVIDILNHPIHKYVFGPQRYFLEYGGRGSGKSVGLTEGLVLLADMAKHKILCAREIQNSISDSVHAQLETHIDNLNLKKRFVVTKNAIRNRATGSEFLYRGLRANVSAVKSLADIDICFVEEAQSVSAASWKVLLPTIRNPGSRFIMACNPENEDDFLSKRWIINPCKDTVAKRVNWNDNPYFPQELEDERQYALQLIETAPTEDARIQAQADYDWVWEGHFKRITASQIIRRAVVKEFEAPHYAEFFYGMDFGFANDPNAIVRCYIEGNDLYVDYESGGRVELDDLPALIDVVPGAKNWPIYCDSARPETISHLKNKFLYNTAPAEKWQGSVEDGIAFLNSFLRIYIHPRCVNLIEETKKYKYKVDRISEQVLPVPIDKDNHFVDALRYALYTKIKGAGVGAMDVDW